LVDTLVLEASTKRCESSSLSVRTNIMSSIFMSLLNSIEDKIKNSLKTMHLLIKDESFMHKASHPLSLTHLRIEVVSDAFKDLRHLQRHRLINSLIEIEATQLKAISLWTYTPEEWERQNHILPRSPSCHKS
jgi:BolA protein